MIGDYDLIIAATAVEHSYSVATFNLKHFQLFQAWSSLSPRLDSPSLLLHWQQVDPLPS
jgi:predicted nucleic acid-binding protein